jgi:multidrug efflux pump subunit AcrB
VRFVNPTPEVAVRTAIAGAVLPLALVLGCLRPASTPTPDPAPEPGVAPAEAQAPGPVVRVVAAYPGANAKVVYDTVAVPLLEQIDGVEGAVRIEAESTSDGTCQIVVRFVPKTDVNVARVLVANRVALAQAVLPELVNRLGITTDFRDPDLLPRWWLTVRGSPKHDGPKHGAALLSVLARMLVKDTASRVPGVADVRVIAGAEHQLRIGLDPDRLAARNLTTADVARALERQNAAVFAGQPGLGRAELVVSVHDRLADPAELEKIVVKADEAGRVVYLRDVARVEAATEPAGLGRMNGEPAAVVAVSGTAEPDAIKKAVAGINVVLPEGLRVELFADLSAATPGFALVELRLPDGASPERTSEAADRAVKLLRELPGVAECLTFSDYEPNAAVILLKLREQNPSTLADLRKSLDPIQEASCRVTDVSGGRKPFPVRIALTGVDDPAKHRAWADAVAERVATDAAATEAAIYPGGDVTQLFVDIDRKKAAQMGVQVNDINVVLRLAAPMPDRTKIDDLKRLKVRAASGEMVPLGSIVRVDTVSGPAALLQLGKDPALRLTANPPEGKTLADAVARCLQIAEEGRKKLGLPDTYRAVDLTDPAR